VPFFIHGLSTSLTESLHALNNKYAIKGKIRSFVVYVLRKNIALLHWNELKRAQRAMASVEDEDEDNNAIKLSFRRKIAVAVIKSVAS
jgi:hypothetical protein